MGEASLEVIDQGFLNPTYGFTHPSRAFLGLPLPYRKHDKQKRKIAFSRTLSRLKRKGFVVKTGRNKNNAWEITHAGKKYLATIENDIEDIILPPEDSKMRLIVFDIPESERRKRGRLRDLLAASGFQQLQKSVWSGKRPLPELIVKQIKSYNLGNCIHIFKVTKDGTLS
ncbi:MAG: CRISPR-associated endonuclease Cas2 [Candidatus Niyogibacteria bacterium]|nr:CRISPR-associated endonuclease Cas2 [Candidatus Niyogibacteria bacterium]